MIHAVLSVLALLEVTLPVTCDLEPSVRPERVEAYYALAQNCLADPPGALFFEPEMEAALVARVNVARKDAGLAPLAVRVELLDPARFHSVDMARTVGVDHLGGGGRSPFDRIAALDRKLVSSAASENLSRVGGAIEPGELIEWIHSGLMNSPGHRMNILSEDATHIGIGVVSDGDTYFTTQLFVRQVTTLTEDAPVSPWGDVDPGDLPALAPPGLGEWTFLGYGVDYGDGSVVPIDGEGVLPEGAGRLVIRGRMNDPDDPMRFFTVAYQGPSVHVKAPWNAPEP
ncbi:MAG: CAP domain-containing protein [Pseudomonadota bacterium]